MMMPTEKTSHNGSDMYVAYSTGKVETYYVNQGGCRSTSSKVMGLVLLISSWLKCSIAIISAPSPTVHDTINAKVYKYFLHYSSFKIAKHNSRKSTPLST